MESQLVFDVVKLEKQNAVARFNRLRMLVKLWQIIELFLIFTFISWSSSRAPVLLKTASTFVSKLSRYLLNNHIVFLIGNSIIVTLFVICRRGDDPISPSISDFYDEYVKHSSIQLPPLSTTTEEDVKEEKEEEKQIVVCYEEKIVKMDEIVTTTNTQCDDVTLAIEEAKRQIRKFQRTHSEKLKREIRPQKELRRSETEILMIEGSGHEDHSHATEIETLSNEEFRRTVDDFIDRHWSKKKLER